MVVFFHSMPCKYVGTGQVYSSGQAMSEDGCGPVKLGPYTVVLEGRASCHHRQAGLWFTLESREPHAFVLLGVVAA